MRNQEHTRQVIPVAERSGTPLEIIVAAQWFIRTLEFKDQFLAKGREIVWHPEQMRQRFESWVQALKWDWAISRQRHFGVPFPVWYSKRRGESGRILVSPPERLPVDPTIDLPDGYSAEDVEPETDVMDTWATSSVTPQLVTRTINDDFGLDRPTHRRLFPMTLRPQSHEIIRTWAFYTIVKAFHHEGNIPWRHIAISGWCLASDGTKMSKSRGNIIDPIRLLNDYGADAVRYWTGTSRLGHDTVLSVNTLQQGKRLVTKLWNAAKLAHIALYQTQLRPHSPKADIEAGIIRHPLDKWLLGHLAEVVKGATDAFEDYEYAQALRLTEEFFWHIHCDNYLEMVKSRVGPSVRRNAEHLSALHTLHHATLTIIRLFAPFIPFVTGTLHDIFEGAVDDTVHARGKWPRLADHADPQLDRNLGDAFVEIVSAGRKVKSDLAVSLRSPVTTLTISPGNGDMEVEQIRGLLGGTSEDLRLMLNANVLTWSEIVPHGQPNALSPDERFRVGLQMAQPENTMNW